jgi:peptide/nickel transport system permease protein
VTAYAARRLLLIAPTLLALSVLLFIAVRVLPPNDPIDIQLGDQSRGDPALKHDLLHYYGLDGPLWQQYLRWLGGFVHGDLGKSLHTKQSVAGELKNRIPVSLELSFIGLFFTWVVSFPIGLICGIYHDRAPDYLLRCFAYFLDAVPGFVIAILALTYLAVYFKWVPPLTFSYAWDDLGRHLKIMILPTLIIALGTSGVLIRFTRTFLLEALRQDYVRTARAKGLLEATVLRRHIIRNLAIPFVTVIGATIPTLITSSVIIEQLFNLPGMGRYLVLAATNLDYPVIQSTTMLFGLIVLASNLITDLSYAWLDPRVSYAGSRRTAR